MLILLQAALSQTLLDLKWYSYKSWKTSKHTTAPKAPRFGTVHSCVIVSLTERALANGPSIPPSLRPRLSAVTTTTWPASRRLSVWTDVLFRVRLLPSYKPEELKPFWVPVRRNTGDRSPVYVCRFWCPCSAICSDLCHLFVMAMTQHINQYSTQIIRIDDSAVRGPVRYMPHRILRSKY